MTKTSQNLQNRIAQLVLEQSAPKIIVPGGVKPRVPPGFVPVRGEVITVESGLEPKFKSESGRKSTAKVAGLRFERKAKRMLEGAFQDIEHYAGRWFNFRDGGGPLRFCQPDFLLISPKKIVIFEIKVSHCELAWWQLMTLYRPVVEKFYGRPSVCVEVVKSYDPFAFFPEEEKAEVVFDFEEFVRAVNRRNGAEDGVVIWQWRD